MSSLRDRLRSTPSVTGDAPEWDPASSPTDPYELFMEWLTTALDAGAPEPQAFTLSTLDAFGAPDARVLVLKDVSAPFELEFATGAESAKGRQLAADSRCAMTFYWSSLARVVRIAGAARPGSRGEASADFLARHPDARAIALTGRQSTVMDDPAEHERLIARERELIEEDPNVVSGGWTVWKVAPERIEFWQGSPTRDHLRVRYSRGDGEWKHERLWP